VINIPPGKEDGPYGNYLKERYAPLLKTSFDKVVKQSASYTFRTCEWGMDCLDVPIYGYVDKLSQRQVFHAGAHAAEEGFDGVYIDCAGDPMLYELRQALTIPVVGLGESSMYAALLMGRRFGIVNPTDNLAFPIEEQLERYGLKHRCAGVLSLPPGGDMAMGPALEDANELLDYFIETGERLVKQGAEVIVPGCCLMSLAAHLTPGAKSRFPAGLKEIDGAIVIDLIGITVKSLETLISLRDAGLSWVSRKLVFASPPPEHKAKLTNVTEDSSLRYWDFTL
ncbi:MAG: aspartate/glutamate racemase family protein, partial [Coriobacteriales bacterium]|jgi:Asp/Glu/hydantoin racemase|nr:aspartate/glutamate racemase family protein [Coriobacteriales bacterium]